MTVLNWEVRSFIFREELKLSESSKTGARISYKKQYTTVSAALKR
jgi:hypothetical protein